MNKHLQRLGIVVILLAVAAALALAAVFFMTRGMTAAADGFLQAVRGNDFAAARGFLAQGFRDSVDDAGLRAYVTRSALSRVKHTQWGGRSFTLSRGELRGTVTTDADSVVPVTFTFVKEGGAWRIYSLSKPSAGLQFENPAVVIPTRDEQLALVQKAWGDFMLAASQRSMRHFHAQASNLWQSQVSADKLNEVFEPVVSGKVSFADLGALVPRLDGEAFIDTSGTLVIRGHYPTAPKPTFYEQRFVHEGAWRLSGFYFRVE